MTDGVPEGFESSRPHREEAGEVAALIAEIELAQEGEAETTIADLLEEWDAMDTDRDAWLVREDGRLVAYGGLELHPRAVIADGFVHPGSTGRGVGRFLVRAMEARAREIDPAGRLESGVSLRDRAGQELLESEGYEPARRFMRMVVELDEAPVVTAIPEVVIRGLASGEERAFHAVYERAFSRVWGHVPLPFDQWWERQVAQGSHDISLFFVAERDGELVGEIACEEHYGGGFVGTLGVLPEARGIGVGRALLLRAFAAFWERGDRRVALGVDAENDTGAERLYESVGMRVAFGAILYEKQLGTGTVGT